MSSGDDLRLEPPAGRARDARNRCVRPALTLSRSCRWAGAVAALVLADPAQAGPPYETDDAKPPHPGRWEVHGYVAGEGLADAGVAEAGFDIAYGAGRDLQVTAVVPVGYRDTGSIRGRIGLGDVELGAKYVFVHEDDNDKAINVAFAPAVTLPTGERGFGSGKATAFLPLWAQKDIGPWSVFGGGGYHLNPGDSNKDFWSGGMAVTHELTPRLTLGAEGHFETAQEVRGKFLAGAGLGLGYQISKQWALLASGGPVLSHRAENGKFRFYLALAFTR